MKHVILAMLVLIVGAAAAAVAVFGWPGGQGPAGFGEGGSSGGAIAPGDWAIYRGDAGMTGVSDGNLPDALRLRWTFKTDGAVYSTPVIADGRVYFGSNDYNVYCVSSADGRKIWTFAAKDQVQAPPLIFRGRVYVGSDDFHLYCLDAANGKPIWKYQAEDRIVGSANILIDPNRPNEPRVVVGSHDYNVYCLDAATGKPAWKASVDNYINGGLAVGGGRILFGSCDSALHAVGVDGNSEGMVETGAFIAVTPAFDGRFAFTGNLAGEFLCVDVPARKVAWHFQAERFADAETGFDSSPAVGRGLVLAGGNDARLYCFDRATGRRRWTFRARGELDCSPVICGARAVVGSTDGILHIVDMIRGRGVWSYDLGRAITTSPAVGAGIVVVGCDDGSVYALEAKR
jgi:eukaryotic-like serine/threonine-protein kinase